MKCQSCGVPVTRGTPEDFIQLIQTVGSGFVSRRTAVDKLQEWGYIADAEAEWQKIEAEAGRKSP